LSRHPAWLNILSESLGHTPYAIEAIAPDGHTVGFLPLVFLDTLLFGRFLVSLPYLNSNGVVTHSADVATALVSRSATLADELNVRYLELRHEAAVQHPALAVSVNHKVHMRLPLPRTEAQLWKGFDPKVRNQVRKGEKPGFIVAWGGAELLPAFHDVLTRNMRDLGSPFYGIELFREIVATFPCEAEVCVVKDGARPIAAALLLHGWGVTEVPTASSLKEYNPTCVNMLLYWHLLKRSVERGQRAFDFGRSTPDGPTYRFKKQWGAEPSPAVWQYHIRSGSVGEMRPDNPRYRRAIRIWQRLPLAVTRRLGPMIVRGIP
jgi:FemAB-related protein (PEP-CTERM system-associated)